MPTKSPSTATLAFFACMIVLLVSVVSPQFSTAATPRAPRTGRRIIARPTPAAPQYQLPPTWYRLPPDLTAFEAGATDAPKYKPPRRMLPSERLRYLSLLAFFRTISLIYVIFYAFAVWPFYRFGAYGLSLYERINRYESIHVGERTALALWRAQRRYERIPIENWHPLSSLPPGANLTFPLPHGETASGPITVRREYWEPENMRHFRLYTIDCEGRPETYCLLVYPKRLGDWRTVHIRSGIIHQPFSPDAPPINWPPQNEITLLGDQGWPATYEMVACNWQRAGINPLLVDLNAITRRASDPPGRQYQPHLGAFWSYRAARHQNHRPRRRHLEIFLLLSEAVMLETDFISPKEVHYDLRPQNTLLPLLRVKPGDGV